MSQGSCLLCCVARGEVQANTVVETERAVAVMNTWEPQATGHVVLFPRRHAVALHEMDSRDLAEVVVAAKKIAGALKLENYNLLHNAGALAGQTVFHAHFHLIPKWSEHDGLRYVWEAGRGFDQQESYRRIKGDLSGAG